MGSSPIAPANELRVKKRKKKGIENGEYCSGMYYGWRASYDSRARRHRRSCDFCRYPDNVHIYVRLILAGVVKEKDTDNRQADICIIFAL